MSSKIENPYKFEIDELALIEIHFASHEDWDKNVFSSLKGKIRDDLRQKQDNKCCYCKKELGFDLKDVDIEHIIPKSTHQKFTFNPLNFALSCPACNTIKGDKNVLSKEIIRYPKNSKYITIIHPHYDDYNEHLIIHNGYLFEAISKKGSHTNTICELFRLKTVEKKAKLVLTKKSSTSQLVNLIMNAPKEELSEVMVELMKRIK